MLHLKRNNHFNELYKCSVSGETIFPGQYYYEDDEDGFVVEAQVYKKMLDEKKKAEFDYTRLNQLTSQLDYEDALKEYERSFLTETIFDRKLAGKGGGY